MLGVHVGRVRGVVIIWIVRALVRDALGTLDVEVILEALVRGGAAGRPGGARARGLGDLCRS